MTVMSRFVSTLIATGLLSFNSVFAAEITGKVGAEWLHFFQDRPSSEQLNDYGSLSIEPELYHPIGDNSEFRAKLFYRYDANSVSRTHADIREMLWSHYEDDWEVHAGIGKVFWGVAESRHLVDVINQSDAIEGLDDEQRLGQGLLQAKWIKEWGVVDLFILPHFREIDYGQAELRPNLGLAVTEARYQNSDETNHIDFAARWSHTFDDLDIGLSYFQGTQRTPILNPVLEGSQPKLQPVYVQTQQLGVDAQYIAGDWLLKLEGLLRQSHDYSSVNGFSDLSTSALVTGFEYTFIGIVESSHDLGLIGEYLYDEWDELTPFQKDWMTGLRWVWNDEASTELLFGHIVDLDDSSQLWQLEAARRLGDDWKLEATGRWVTQADEENVTAQALKGHDLLSMKLYYYF